MIYLDPRAGSGYLLPLLHKRGLPAEHKWMRYGDVAFRGYGPDGRVDCGIELKVPKDLVDSIISKRLQEQLRGMYRSYSPNARYLMIHGQYRDSHNGITYLNAKGRWEISRAPMGYTSLAGMLETVSHCGFNVVHVDDALNGIEALYRWRQKRWGQHTTMKAFAGLKERSRGIIDSPPPVAIAVHATMGMGWVKAHSVALLFPTIEILARASEEEIGCTPGVGPKLAARIYRTIRARRAGL